MKTYQVIAKFMLLITALAIPFAPVASAADGKETKIEAIVVARDGKDLAVHSELGDITLILTEATKIQQISGFLGFSRKTVGAENLIPGLRVTINTEPGSMTNAMSVKFYEDDLKTAQQMQAALAKPKEQIAANQEGVAANRAGVAANKEGLVQAKAEDEAIAKRFEDLADYDLKGEGTILFDINSTTLSAKAKDDLQALAATAKTFKGYLIQVAGYADSTGSASHNQNLSDRRADSVATYLQQECNVAISRVLAPAAMGTSKPIAANETAQGRAENRRVTVKILVNRGIAQ